MAFKRKWRNRSGTRAYYAWRSAKNRCTNPNFTSYEHYGARGIKMCQKWLQSYDAFFNDMGDAPEGMTLERIDVNGNYDPSNCVWATTSQQSINKRTNVFIEYNGDRLTMSQWADKLGINRDTLWRRLNVYKIPLEKALTPESLVPTWKHGTRHGYTKGCRCDECRAAHAKHCREMRWKRKKKALAAQQGETQ